MNVEICTSDSVELRRFFTEKISMFTNSFFFSFPFLYSSVTNITVKRIFELWLQPELLYKMSGYSGTFEKSLKIIESLSKKVSVILRYPIRNSANETI